MDRKIGIFCIIDTLFVVSVGSDISTPLIDAIPRSRRAVLLVDIAVVEVAVAVELVVDRGMGGGKVLPRRSLPE